jgi:DNA-binding IclR family transcriptional regulator
MIRLRQAAASAGVPASESAVPDDGTSGSSVATRRKNRNGIQVITRAAHVLQALEARPEGLSLGEIASKVGLPRSTVQRIVSALAAERFVMSARPDGGVRLGPALLRLASHAKLEAVEVARPHIRALSERIRETVDLAILDGAELLFIDHIVAPRRLRLVSAIGIHFPLHCTANGKAFLAAMSDAEVQRLVGTHLKPYTRHTITSLARLISELETVRASGIAFDREEHTLGISAVGTSVRDAAGVMTAISVPMPTSRFSEQEKEVAAALLACRDRIQRELGTSRAPSTAPPRKRARK